MSNRKHNFSAGPCTLPLEVLEEAQKEFVDYQGAGMSLIEMSHRGKHFDAVANEAMALSMEVFQVPDDFSVLFLQGGAILQFSMVPMNLLVAGQKGAYVNSGSWADGAITDAREYGEIYTAWDGAENNYTRMPSTDELEIKENTRYLHITTNETIGGIRFLNGRKWKSHWWVTCPLNIWHDPYPGTNLIWYMVVPRKISGQPEWRLYLFASRSLSIPTEIWVATCATIFTSQKNRCLTRRRCFQFTCWEKY